MFWGKRVQRGRFPRGDGIVLWLRHVWLHNSFQTLAVVKLLPGGHGTQVRVTLRSHFFVAAFMTLWLGFAILFNIAIFGAALGGAAHLGDLGFTLPFPIVGFGFVALGRLFARPDRTALLDFIRQTTGAQDLASELRPSC